MGTMDQDGLLSGTLGETVCTLLSNSLLALLFLCSWFDPPVIANIWPCDVGYCLWLDVLENFLALRAEAGLNVAPLTELAKMPLPTALGAGRNAGILEMEAAARCTDACSIHVKS